MRDGRSGAPAPLFGGPIAALGGMRSEPDSAGSLEVTDLRDEEGEGERRRRPYTQERAGEKRLLRRQQSRSAWNLSSNYNSSSADENGGFNNSNSSKAQPPRKAKVKSLLSLNGGSSRKKGSNKISPFTPLPSVADRKKLLQSRGNRICHTDEDSDELEQDKEEEEEEEAKGDDNGARRKRSVALPATRSEETRGETSVEVMTIHHENGGRSTPSSPAALSDEEEIRFEEAREII